MNASVIRGRIAVVAVAAAFVLGIAAGPAVAATPSGATPPATGPDLKIYVPIKQAHVTKAPPKKPTVAAPSPTSQFLSASAGEAWKVSFQKVPGTLVPIWWLALGLLTVPLARWWRRWTASMFV